MSCTENFETPLTRNEIKQRAKEHWNLWRLVLDAKMDFNVVFYQMTPSEIDEANSALDIYVDMMKPKKNRRIK